MLSLYANNRALDEDEPLHPSEREQYEKVIKVLLKKVDTLTADVRSKEDFLQHQDRLINAYKIKNEGEATRSKHIIEKAIKATHLVKRISHETYQEHQQQHINMVSIRQENKILRKIL